MLSKLKMNLLQVSALALVLSFGAIGTVAAQDGASISGSLCSGANNLQVSSETQDPSECSGGDEDPTDKVNTLITQIVNIISVIVGIVAVIMIIYGGFKYITSGGDSGNVTTAKNTILYAIIGLIIVALAQFIVRFVLSKATETAA
jgi:Type IV secretion system pilin